MGSMSARDLVQQGAHAHDHGRYAEAERCYRQALQLDPGHPDALHLLGVLAYQAGEHGAAEELIVHGLLRAPHAAMMHANLGRALQALGRREESIRSFERSLVLRPESASTLAALADVLLQVGRAAESEAAYRRALAIDPSSAQGWFGLGCALERQQRLDDAERCYAEAVTRNPTFFEAVLNRAAVLQALLRFTEARDVLEQAIRVQPDFAEAHFNLGNVLRESGEIAAAIDSYRRAADIDPSMVEAHYARAALLTRAGRVDESRRCLDLVLQAKVVRPRACIARGNLLLAEHRIAEAMADFNRALAADASDAEAHFSRAMALLVSGRLEEGWQEYEYRLRRASHRAARSPEREALRWTGEDLGERTLLVHAEQGLGDTLQFLRYIPLIASRARRVVVEVQPELLTLARSVCAQATFIARDEPVPAFDAACPLLSLPAILGTSLDSVPARVPYLFVDGHDASAARCVRQQGRPLRVGLVWAGNPHHTSDAMRSIPARKLGALVSIADIVFVSLQKGRGSEELEGLRQLSVIEDLGAQCEDFMDTACALGGLDLVITVDTSIAHLAGALGRPVWILLAYSPDWRWLLEREDSPWYPTARLFRQTSPGDWEEVLARVACALRGLVERHGTGDDAAADLTAGGS